jgi:glutamate-1-semialdehyde 2,1-aminomutase
VSAPAQTRAAETIAARYAARTPRSRALWERARQVMPMGVSAGIKYFAPYPTYLVRGEGGTVWDSDGNEYIDLVMGAGPHLLGHRHPAVMARVREQLDGQDGGRNGGLLGGLVQSLAPSPLEVEMSERLRGLMPYLERLRFTNTGSEAVRSAIRAARAATGRTMIAKFEGHYHGSDDPVMASANVRRTAGTADRPEAVAESAGIPDYVLDDVLILPFNDAAATEALIDEHGTRLAAVLMEPVAFSSGGAIPADVELARAVRRATERHGIVLIFDEIVTALRIHPSGAPAYLGVTPDLSCIGKAIGGGFPLAAFGGRAELMEAVLGPGAAATGKRIFQSGTFTANPVALAAGLATLDVLEREPVNEHIDELATRLRGGLDDAFNTHAFAARGFAAVTTGAGSIFQVHFTAAPPRNRREILAGDLDSLELFLLGLVTEGIYWTPIHPGLTSYAHTAEQMDRAIAAADRVLAVMAEA